MKVHFLEAHVPLTKRYTANARQPYPNAFEFRSHEHFIANPQDFARRIATHAAQGHCLLKGELDRPLEWESRAGHTDAYAPTRWVCLDIDGLASVPDIPAFMARIGLAHVSHVLQWSASYGVGGNFALRAHVFVMLSAPVAPALLKLWLRQLNLTHFQGDLALTKTQVALHWGLDITTCQSDKLVFITAPHCTPRTLDQFTGQRIQYVASQQEFFDFAAVALMAPEQLKGLEEAEINRLRRAQNLPERKSTQFRLKEHRGEAYLPRPDAAVVTGVRTERGFTYLNLNGGDSWGYWHPEGDPTFIHNFKGEPVYKTAELVPDYHASLRRQSNAARQAQHPGRLFLAFRDHATADYLNGTWDPVTDELDLAPARSERQLADFLAYHGQPMPEVVPVWRVIYDPGAPTIDLAANTVNVFRPSRHMREAAAAPATRQPGATPTILRLLTHVVGAGMVEHLVNWIAFVFRERRLPGTAWVWHGVQGTGKGVLLHYVLKPLLGESNVAVKRLDNLEEKFNGYLERNLLCFVDEVQVSESRRAKTIMANLKNEITEPVISVRHMHQAQTTAINRVGWIFASNMPDPVVIEASDRRFNVGDYQSAAISITDADVRAIEAELPEFALMLQRHTIDLQAVRTPRTTQAKQVMIKASQTAGQALAAALVAGDLAVLWEALPTNGTALLGTSAALKLEPYRQLVNDLVLGRRDRLTRDELYVLFNYNVANVPQEASAFTRFMTNCGLATKEIRIGAKTTRGVMVAWSNDDAWFAERRAEIDAERAPRGLKVVTTSAAV